MNEKMTIAQALIAENKRTKDTFLDLENCGLTELPKELFECVWLQSLSLNGNKLQDITGIQVLENLETLSIIANEITDLTPIQELIELRSLDVGVNNISDISPVEHLYNLEKVGFSYNQVTELPLFLRNLLKIKSITFLPNPYQLKNYEYLSLFFNGYDVEYFTNKSKEIDSFNLFHQIANTVEKQIKEQENWINLKIPKDFKRIFSRYILLFSEYVSIAKGKVIEFHVRSQDDALVLVTNGKTNISREKVLEYLEEYVMLLAQDLENQRLVLNIENQEITNNPKLEVKIDTFTLRYQIEKGALKSEMRILELENKHLQQELSIYRLQSERDNQRIIFLQDMFQHGIRKTI